MPPRMPDHDPFAVHTPIPLPRTPETGHVYASELDNDIRDIAAQAPPLDPEDPGYNEGYDDAYHATRHYVVDATARFAAQEPDNFNRTVSHIAGDTIALRTTIGDGDPRRPEIERSVIIQAEALAPVAQEAVGTDPNMTLDVAECQQAIDAVVDRAIAAAREHKAKGENLLIHGAPQWGEPSLLVQLQQYAELGLGPLVAQSLERGLRAATAALEAATAKRSGLVDKSLAADHAARQAEAAAGTASVTEPTGFSATLRKRLLAAGRAIDPLISGRANRELTAIKYQERDADAAAAQAKYLERLKADSHADAAAQRRRHDLAQFNELRHGQAEMSNQNALEAATNLYKMLIDPSTGNIITAHNYTPLDGTPTERMIKDLTEATANKTASGTGDVDPVAVAQMDANRVAEVHRAEMVADMGKPDSLALQFARVDGLYRQIENLDDEIAQIVVDSHSDRARLAARLRYSQLMQYRQSLQGVYNQAAAHYAQYSIEHAPNTPNGRDLDGRLPMHIIEDGGVLIGDDDYRAIHWQNGDHAALVDKRYKGPGVFEAIVHMADGTAVNYGRFVRFAPDGHIRGEWSEQRPSVAQLRASDQRRRQVRRLHNAPGPDGYSASEAFAAAVKARRDMLFANLELPSIAERAIDDLDPLTGVLLPEARNTAVSLELTTYLNFDRIRAGVEAQRTQRASAIATTAEELAEQTADVAALNAQLTRMDREHHDFAAIPGNLTRVRDAQRTALQLNSQRYATLRAAAYNGRTTLLGDGTIVLPQEQPRDLRGAPSMHELLGLPDGTWRFGPDGAATQVFTSRDKKVASIKRTYGPDENYVRAA